MTSFSSFKPGFENNISSLCSQRFVDDGTRFCIGGTAVQVSSAEQQRYMEKLCEIVSDEQDHLWLLEHHKNQECKFDTFNSVYSFLKFLGASLTLFPKEGVSGELHIRRRSSAFDSSSNTSSSSSATSMPSLSNEGRSNLSSDLQRLQYAELSHVPGLPDEDLENTSSDMSTSSSSSSGSTETVEIVCGRWIDLQTKDPRKIETLLALFGIDNATAEEIVSNPVVDSLETVVSRGYATLNLLAQAAVPSGDCVKEGTEDGNDTVVVTVIVFEEWLITIHDYPFCGLLIALREVQSVFSWQHSRELCVSGASHNLGSTAPVPVMTPQWLLSVLIDVVIDSFLPDPIEIAVQAERLSARAINHCADLQDQHELNGRIAQLRGALNALRASLYHKEHLLQSLLSREIRNTILSKESAVTARYRHTARQMAVVTNRLNSVAEAVVEASGSFVLNVTVDLGIYRNTLRTSAELLQVTQMVALPMLTLSTLYGMNCEVPFRSDITNTLAPFLCIAAIMVVWVLLFIPRWIKLGKRVMSDHVFLTADVAE